MQIPESTETAVRPQFQNGGLLGVTSTTREYPDIYIRRRYPFSTHYNRSSVAKLDPSVAITISETPSQRTKCELPYLVHSQLANTSAMANIFGSLKRLFEASGDYQTDNGSSKLTKALHGQDNSHHGTTPFSGSKPSLISRDCIILIQVLTSK